MSEEEENINNGLKMTDDSEEKSKVDSQQSLAEPEALNSKSEIKTMEVHHHPQVEKKSFKEYLLEGLMIFLAVTMGFFAENIREKLVETRKSHEYIKSINEDLSKDEIKIPFLLDFIKSNAIKNADSISLFLSTATLVTPANSIYRMFREISRQQGIEAFTTNRTITQLKNAGQIYLIADKQVVDKILEYYQLIDFIKELQTYLWQIKFDLAKNSIPLLQGDAYAEAIDSEDNTINPGGTVFLRSVDKEMINTCLIALSNVKGLSISIYGLVQELHTKSISLKKLLHEKYKVENM